MPIKRMRKKIKIIFVHLGAIRKLRNLARNNGLGNYSPEKLVEEAYLRATNKGSLTGDKNGWEFYYQKIKETGSIPFWVSHFLKEKRREKPRQHLKAL